MKILPFTIPVKVGESISTSHEIQPQFYPHYHQHKEIQLIFIIQGSGSLLFDHQFVEFYPNSFYLIGANQAHVFKNDPNLSSRIETINIFIDYETKLSAIFDLPEFELIRERLSPLGLATIPAKFIDSIKYQMESILVSVGSQKILKLLQLLDVLCPRLVELVKRNDQLISENDGSRLNQVIQYIWDHYQDDLSLADCAQITNMQPESFSRYFKKRTNTNFSKYLNEVRIHQACRLMNTRDDLSMTTLAYLCGFNHTSHFNRVFKEMKGTTPSSYKMNLSSFPKI